MSNEPTDDNDGFEPYDLDGVTVEGINKAFAEAGTPELVEGERWYRDGKPGTVYSLPAPTGYYSFHFDGAGFTTSSNTNDEHTWERCDESAVDLQKAIVRAKLAEQGIRI